MPNGSLEWVKKRVDSLTAGSDEVSKIHPDVYNSFNTWSALKLIVHSATVNMYTTVCNKHFESFFYIDALAGSGLSEYGDEEFFLGSPIVAAQAATTPFTKMYFIEGDEDKKDALEARLDFAFEHSNLELAKPDDWKVFHGDANDVIHDVINDIWEVSEGQRPFNTLGFIDNQAMDLHWDSMEALGTLTSDLLVNYQGASAVGMNMNNRRAHKGEMKEFFGEDMWEVEPKTRERYKEAYKNQIATLYNGDCEQVDVKVDSGFKSYEYDMLYSTRKTQNDSKYVDAIRYVKKFVENVDGADVEELLDILHGDQAVMADFAPQMSSIDESLLGSADKNGIDDAASHSDQTGLDEWC